jgi:hypothetical protein
VATPTVANTGTKLHGKNGAIYFVAEKGAVGAQKVANKVEWTLNLNRDYVDATVFGETNKTYLVGLRDVQGTFNGLFDSSGDLIVNNTTTDQVSIYLYADDRELPYTRLIAYGLGLLDGSITASITDAVRVTGNFRAAASWTVNSVYQTA